MGKNHGNALPLCRLSAGSLGLLQEGGRVQGLSLVELCKLSPQPSLGSNSSEIEPFQKLGYVRRRCRAMQWGGGGRRRHRPAQPVTHLAKCSLPSCVNVWCWTSSWILLSVKTKTRKGEEYYEPGKPYRVTSGWSSA